MTEQMVEPMFVRLVETTPIFLNEAAFILPNETTFIHQRCISTGRHPGEGRDPSWRTAALAKCTPACAGMRVSDEPAPMHVQAAGAIGM
jgi:hypothetical protein